MADPIQKVLDRLSSKRVATRHEQLSLCSKVVDRHLDKTAKSETYALTDVRANDVDKVRIALEEAGYKTRPYQHRYSGHSVAMIEVDGDARGIAKVMFPWVKKGDAQRVRGKVEDHFKRKNAAAPIWLAGPIENGRMNVKVRADDTWSFDDLLGTIMQKWGPKFTWADQNPKKPTFENPKGQAYGIVRKDQKPMSKDDMKAIDKKLKL